MTRTEEERLVGDIRIMTWRSGPRFRLRLGPLMKIVLQDLIFIHAALRGHPVNHARYGGLALQRAGHTSPVTADITDNGVKSHTEIEWLLQSLILLEVLDTNRITEEGAEAVALAYMNAKGGWVVKRRLQRGEYADWLMTKPKGWLALEVSGMISGDSKNRLKEKTEQVNHCSLPVDRIAVVVAFDTPRILAASV